MVSAKTLSSNKVTFTGSRDQDVDIIWWVSFSPPHLGVSRFLKGVLVLCNGERYLEAKM